MPLLELLPSDFAPVTEVAGGIFAGVVIDAGLALARVDEFGYSRELPPQGVAVFVTETQPMSALAEVFGLLIYGSNLDGVGVQVTVDDNIYLAWDGGAWVEVAIDGTYNSASEFSEHSGVLPLVNPRMLGLRLRLTVQDIEGELVSPIVAAVRVFVEWDAQYDVYVDLYQTLHALGQQLRIPVTRRDRLSAASNIITLESKYVADPGQQIKVFNLTTDPLRNTNLFQAYAPDTGVITLTGVQGADSDIELGFSASTRFQVSASDEMVEVTSLPFALFRLSPVSGTIYNVGDEFSYKIGTDTKLTRVRLRPAVKQIQVIFRHWDRSAREAVSAVKEMVKLLSSKFMMLGTGCAVQVLESVPASFDDQMQQSFSAGVWQGELRFLDYFSGYAEFAATETIVASFGSRSSPWHQERMVIEE